MSGQMDAYRIVDEPSGTAVGRVPGDRSAMNRGDWSADNDIAIDTGPRCPDRYDLDRDRYDPARNDK